MGLHISGGQVTQPITIFRPHAFKRIQAFDCSEKFSDLSDIGFLSAVRKLIRSDHTSKLLQHDRFSGVNVSTLLKVRFGCPEIAPKRFLSKLTLLLGSFHIAQRLTHLIQTRALFPSFASAKLQ
ncbi:hypothetical protein Pla52n_70170 [Stieleria varia]|uniref:Uncharacterized protein n=1 Tax=Stieleria varia TaxID=2528005 RepID=A0A5C5ZI57_9BACT|nr:hypothetical protein Pla52n_70170 [Stieleria varia]